MASKKEKAVLVSRRLLETLPQPSVLVREALRSMWSDAQCEAATRNVRVEDVLAQAEQFLSALQKVRDDVPVTRARLAWVAELTRNCGLVSRVEWCCWSAVTKSAALR